MDPGLRELARPRGKRKPGRGGITQPRALLFDHPCTPLHKSLAGGRGIPAVLVMLSKVFDLWRFISRRRVCVCFPSTYHGHYSVQQKGFMKSRPFVS